MLPRATSSWNAKDTHVRDHKYLLAAALRVGCTVLYGVGLLVRTVK